MLSNLELERLTESDVGRRLLDTGSLTGWVRIEPRPVRRVVVDFSVRTGEAGRQRDVRVGTWPDRTLAEIRQNAERVRRVEEESVMPPVAMAARALSQAPASSVTSVPAKSAALPPAVRTPMRDDEPPPAASGPLFAGATSVRTVGATSVADVFEQWRLDALVARKDGGESVRRSMHKDVLPTLGASVANAVRRGQVVAVLERIVERGSARQAGCVLADLRQMFRWAMQAGLVESDPTATLRKADFGGAPQARRRRLTDEEIVELASKMRGARLARHVRHAIWLMLATGARIGEIAHARWQDIDLEARTWTIPSEYSHSGRPHLIPLSDFAIRHFCPEGEGRRSDVWVFPGRYASEALSPKALGKQIRDRQRGSHIRGRASGTTTLLLAGGAWTPLDLRRTAATLLAELGTRPDVIAACLDHAVRGEAQRAYHRLPTLDERRDALQRLGQHLDPIERSPKDADRRAA
ncbi:MAG: tyrosine-type recombinase/integrase [Burkholderiaceae bacterium]